MRIMICQIRPQHRPLTKRDLTRHRALTGHNTTRVGNFLSTRSQGALRWFLTTVRNQRRLHGIFTGRRNGLFAIRHRTLNRINRRNMTMSQPIGLTYGLLFSTTSHSITATRQPSILSSQFRPTRPRQMVHRTFTVKITGT